VVVARAGFAFAVERVAAGFAFAAVDRVAGFFAAVVREAAGFAFAAGFALAAAVRELVARVAVERVAVERAAVFGLAAVERDAAAFGFAAAALGFAFAAAGLAFAAVERVPVVRALVARDVERVAVERDAAGLAFAAGFFAAAAAFFGAAFFAAADAVARLDPELLLVVLDVRVVLDERDDDRVAAGTARDLEARASPSALGSRVIKDLLGWIARMRLPTRPPFTSHFGRFLRVPPRSTPSRRGRTPIARVSADGANSM
jgi:hypothetical protein